MKLETITLEIDTNLYEEAKAVFEREGYTVSEAVTLFFKTSIACDGFPFHVTEEDMLQIQ